MSQYNDTAFIGPSLERFFFSRNNTVQIKFQIYTTDKEQERF